MGDNFPYWPPTAATVPQNPNAILAVGLERGLQDLVYTFVIPQFRETDVPINGRPALNKQISDAQGDTPTFGVVSNNKLFDMFQASVIAPPASQVEKE